MLRRIQGRTGLWWGVMGTAKITLGGFKNKLKQGGHVLSHTVQKARHQRNISAAGRVQLGHQDFHSWIWKRGCKGEEMVVRDHL